jgi:Protein of unknown function (DUF2975)
MASHKPSRAVTVATNLSTLWLVFGIAFGLFMVVSAAVGAGDRDIAVHQEVAADQLASLPDGVTGPAQVPVTVRIDRPDTGQVLLDLGRGLVMLALFLAGLWLVRGLLLSVRQGDPFTMVNVRRLRAMGFLLVIGAPLALFISQSLEGALAASSTVGELGNAVEIPGPGPFIGLGVFVLAEVFAHGVRLREDVEGTI